MRIVLTAALVVAAGAGLALAQSGTTPPTVNDALLQGYEIASVEAPDRDTQGHVIRLKRGDRVIVCELRFIGHDDEPGDRRTHALGVCAGAENEPGFTVQRGDVDR